MVNLYAYKGGSMILKRIGILLIMVLFLLACGEKGADKPEDIGVKLDLTLLPETITDFLFLKMNYGFSVEENFKKLDI